MRSTVDNGLTSMRAHIPTHIVYRGFPHETVVLNLETGLYHGLNAVAGDMLTALERSDSVGAAAARLAADYDQPLERVTADLTELCQGLVERGLIRLEPAPA
jgi:Coenzyme PQQ synthesis protein D (PqqD)